MELFLFEVRQFVLDIISDIAPDEDVSGLDDKKSLREQLDLDSMDFLEYSAELACIDSSDNKDLSE